MAQKQEGLTTDTLLNTEARLGTGAGTAVGAFEAEVTATRVNSPGKDAWRRFARNWAAMTALTIILLLIFVAVFAPWLHTANPTIPKDLSNVSTYAPSSSSYWLGTDENGIDLYSRVIYGLRIPLIVGILGAAVSTLIGSLLGVIAGYSGGVVDSFLSRFTDLVFAFPAFLLAILCAAFFGGLLDSSPINNYLAGGGRVVILTIVFAAVGWPALMRFVRSLALSLKEQQFVEAARTSGTSSWRILVRHLLPNMYGLILVQSGFLIVGFIYFEAVISLLGLGVQPPNPDLGVMLAHGPAAFGFPNGLGMTFWPASALAVLMLAFSFLTDGIRDAVDPRGSK